MGVKLGQHTEQLVTIQTAIKLCTGVVSHVAVKLLQMVKNVFADVARVRQRRLYTSVGMQIHISRRSASVIFCIAIMCE